MDKRTFWQLVCGLAITVGLALAVHWRVTESPNSILIVGLWLIAGGAVALLNSLGLIEFQRKRGFRWDSSGDGGQHFDGGGDGGD